MMVAWADTAIHLGLLVAATVAHHISSTPPHIAQKSSDHLLCKPTDRKDRPESCSEKDVLYGQRWFNRVGMMGVAASRHVVWPIMLLEVFARLLSLYPSSSLSRAILPFILPTTTSQIVILPVPHPAAPQKLLLGTLPRMSILAVLSILTGFAIRRWCFAVMGRHFSFTHTTLEGHELIKNGPYSIVRHPSYTGEVLVRWGMVALLLSPDSYLHACGAVQYSSAFLGTLGAPQRILFASVRAGLIYFIAWNTFNCPYLFWRAPREDATLREAFGKQWIDYAKEVPYRFIPYIA